MKIIILIEVCLIFNNGKNTVPWESNNNNYYFMTSLNFIKHANKDKKWLIVIIIPH